MDYIQFWFQALKNAFDLSRAIVEMVGFLIVLFIGFGGLSLVKKHFPKLIDKMSELGLSNEPRRNFLFVLYTIVVGPYLMYKEQANKVSALEEFTNPRLEGYINQYGLGQLSEKSVNKGAIVVTLWVSISNQGRAPSIADAFQVTLIMKDSSRVVCQGIMSPDGATFTPYGMGI